MKSSVRYAVAAALLVSAVGTQSAFAALPAAFDATEQANNVLYFSGATATDGASEGVFITNSCAAGTAHIFRGTNQRAVLCSSSQGLGDVGYVKESTGGSENGSVAVTQGANLNFLNVFSGSFVCAGTDNVANTADAGSFNPALSINVPTGAGANEYTNCTPNAARPATAGISDVEAGLLGVVGAVPVTVLPQAQILFGTPVSLNLYRALQIAQGITARTECDGVIDGVFSDTGRLAITVANMPVGSARDAEGEVDGPAELDTPACAPSLSKAQVASLYNGLITNWSELTVNGTSLTAAPGVTAPSSASVYICRRGDESGTQIGTRAYFLNQGCRGTSLFRAPTPGGGSATAPLVYANGNNALVHAGQSSGDVRNCLDDRDDQNRWAIGVLSTDSTVTGTAALGAGGNAPVGNIGGAGGNAIDALGVAGAEVHQREFRFVKIDGYNPSLEVAANGGYDFFTENVCTRANSLSGNQATLFGNLCGATGMNACTTIRGANESLDNQPWGDGGTMCLPTVAGNTPHTAPVSQLNMETSPVNGFAKNPGGGLNNCNAPLAVTNSIPLPTPTTAPVGAEDATL